MSDADDDAPTDIEVEPVDIDELVNTRRVRSLFDAREDCRKMRTEAKMKTDGRGGEAASTAYRNVLESYVRECEPLFAKTDNGRRYWTEYRFGTFKIKPETKPIPGDGPGSGRQIAGSGEQIINEPEANTVDVRGLNSLFQLASPTAVQVQVRQRSKRLSEGYTAKNITAERQIPFDILDRMYSAVNSYLNELGLGIDVQEGEQQTKVDDDLLNEVEAWRRANL